jgi:uncharacterized membrane protein (DUF2068 family)
MNRSRWITGAIVLHGLLALALVALTIFLLKLARTASPEVSQGLKTAAMILWIPALLAATSWYGLWKEMLWGWWLALVTDFGLLAVFIYSVVDDGLGNIDWEMVGVTVLSAIFAVVLLIPVVRRFYWLHGTAGKGLNLNE